MANQYINNNDAGSCLGEQEQRIETREHRYYAIGHSWIFKTREGIDHGPYLTELTVKKAVDVYVKKMKKI